MRYLKALSVSFCVMAGATSAFAAKPPLDCSRRSLAEVVARANGGDAITFTGVCAGPIVVRTDSLTLTGVGTAIIDGGGHDAVSVMGAHGVELANFEVRNGLNGIIGVNGAHLTLTGIHVHDNNVFGISLQTSSSLCRSNTAPAFPTRSSENS